MVMDHSDIERGNPLPPYAKIPINRQDSTYHGVCYTSRGALTGTRNNVERDLFCVHTVERRNNSPNFRTHCMAL